MRTERFSEVALVGGLFRPAVHETLERYTGWKIHWFETGQYTHLGPLYRLLDRVQLVVIATGLVRQETRRFVLTARKRGVTVVPVGRSFSPAQIVYRLQNKRGGQGDG